MGVFDKGDILSRYDINNSDFIREFFVTNRILVIIDLFY